ncbi:MAG: hypothetical protein EPN86_00100 [Nanoarchaeota archaeon]|nr:MAG: hypothetical protein EPN86_00100 [Nanoarchaeota archaeon]
MNSKVLCLYLLAILACAALSSGAGGADATNEEASRAINESYSIIQEMTGKNFPTSFINDTLAEAKRVFEQARYAQIARGEINATPSEKAAAFRAGELVDLEGANYSAVIALTEKISGRRDEAYNLSDSISALGIVIANYYASLPPQAIGEAEPKSQLEKAKQAFREDRFDDAKSLLADARSSLDSEKSSRTVLNILKENTGSFVQKNLLQIAATIAVLSLLGFVLVTVAGRMRLKSRIRKMNAEEMALQGLMKKAQGERFIEKKISGIVYDIRMKKYTERLQEIKETLPVLESRLRRK